MSFRVKWIAPLRPYCRFGLQTPRAGGDRLLGPARASGSSTSKGAECLPAKGSKRLAKALTEVYKERR
jgi:hypothetical protein